MRISLPVKLYPEMVGKYNLAKGRADEQICFEKVKEEEK